MKTLAEMRAELLAKRAGQYDSAAGSGVAGGQAVRHTAQLVATDIVTGAGMFASLVRGFYVGLMTRTEPQRAADRAADRVAKRSKADIANFAAK